MSEIEIEELGEIAIEEAPGKYVIVCKHCRFHLTNSDFAMAVEGHHEHVQWQNCYSHINGAAVPPNNSCIRTIVPHFMNNTHRS